MKEPKPSSNWKCRLCGNPELALLIDLGNQPIAHRLLESDEQEFTHALRVDYCPACGLGQICDPIAPEILYRQYNYCFSSWKPEPHRETELDLICSHKNGASVFEIGCNDGLFLEELRKRGQKLCVGLEPNSFSQKIATGRGLPVYETFLNEETCTDALRTHGKFDVIVSRQVLEHVSDMSLFFKCIDSLLTQDGFIFIDVPNVGPGLRVGDCTIVWEEHVNYFTKDVLLRALDHFGFWPVAFKEFNYSGGTLAVLARRKGAADHFDSGEDYKVQAASFDGRVRAYRARLADALAKARRSFDKIALYGVGCRACTLVNGLDLGKLIDFAVDDQVERQGKLMPGSKLAIHSSRVLAEPGLSSLVILAVNQENENKVKKNLETLCQQSKVRFLSVLGPTAIEEELDQLIRFLG